MDKINKGQKPTKADKEQYRHDDIKDTLVAETSGKCAYCESVIEHVSHAHIEHMSPKSRFPRTTYKWDNMTLACPVCNVKKGDKVGMFNPYQDDPDQHFHFLGPLFLAKAGHSTARTTEASLELNRSALMEKRKEKVLAMRNLVELIRDAPDQPLQKALEQELKQFAQDSAEYAALARSFLRVAIPGLL